MGILFLGLIGLFLGGVLCAAWTCLAMLFGFVGPTPDQLQGLWGLFAVIGLLIGAVLQAVWG